LPRQAFLLLNRPAFAGHTTGRADRPHPARKDGAVGNRPIARRPNRLFEFLLQRRQPLRNLVDWETIKVAGDPLRPLNNTSEQLPRRRKHIALLRRRDLASWPDGAQSTGQILGDDLNHSVSFWGHHLRQKASLRRCHELQPDIVKRRWKANCPPERQGRSSSLHQQQVAPSDLNPRGSARHALRNRRFRRDAGRGRSRKHTQPGSAR
jgi:hypothetical protein